MTTLNYSDFKELVSNNNNQAGNTITVGDVKFNKGLIYDPEENGGQGFSFTGEDANEKTVDYLYDKAITVGSIDYRGEEYKIV